MKIKLKIGNEHVILQGTDTYNFELCWKGTRTDPKTKITEDIWIARKWFASLPAALDYIMKMKIIASTATTLADLQKDIIKIKKELIYCYNDNTDL